MFRQGQVFKMSDTGTNLMYSLEDYMMREKRSKSVFSSANAVKRLFVLDFSVRAFYYKHSEDTSQCKPISTFSVSSSRTKNVGNHPSDRIRYRQLAS